MGYLNNALRGALENPERTLEKNGSGVWIGIFRDCRSDTDPHFLLISAADPIRISDRDNSNLYPSCYTSFLFSLVIYFLFCAAG